MKHAVVINLEFAFNPKIVFTEREWRKMKIHEEIYEP
jgi:hypothetical protein